MPIITIDRSTPFDPEKLLDQKGFAIRGEEDPRSLAITELDTDRLRLEFGMYETNNWQPLFASERIYWVKSKGLIRPDGKILEALKENYEFPQAWKEDHPHLGGPMSIHFDGTPLSSSWDGRDFSMYAIFNRMQQFWETPYLGPWAGLQPAAVIIS